ncbi:MULTISPECIES: hypothetical protein [unclassified Iodidimonas]|jgi:hypothetical protein|uniref:hypothetical protein n=1 Tax=unclassified Iodidimonas TaxID=2626145 RepID=UPI002482662E|nr:MULTISPECIES: hypothetical protein [unclassified Iodidimonas]
MDGSSTRQEQARVLVNDWLQSAKVGETIRPDQFQHERKILEELIPVNTAGFRGIVLTAIVGKQLNPNYDPTQDFYGSSPRTLFEKGIYYALRDSRVPCGKSDPLNVAKNQQVIDANWARGRRPESAALAAVEYISLIQSNWENEEYRHNLIALFFSRLWQYAEFCMSADVPIAEFEGTPPVRIASKLAKFTADFPEGGATPQIVVGTLISKLREGDENYSTVGGVFESVFGTNTTSKKPADVWEEMADGSIGQLYEITAKPVDEKRLDDCVESLKAMDLGGKIVTFICRLPQDVSTLAVSDGILLHGGVLFQFLDINDFIKTTFCILPTLQQSEVIAAVDKFVKDTNRKTEVKTGWGIAFG